MEGSKEHLVLPLGMVSSHPMGGWMVSSVTPWEGGQLAVSPHGRVDGWQCRPMGGWTVSSVAPWEGGRLAVSPHGRVDG